MIIFIFYIILLFFQLFLFGLSIKSKEKTMWMRLFKIEVMSIVSVIIYQLLFMLLSETDNWSRNIMYTLNCFVIVIYIVLLLISIFIRNLMKKKIIDTKVKEKNKFIYIILMIIFFVVVIFSLSPDIYKKINKDNVSNYVIDYLNNRYGNGNYNIVQIEDLSNCGWFCHENTYEFVISSDYLKQNFEVKIDKDSNKIISDNFIELYAMENNWYDDEIMSFNDYLINVVSENLNHDISTSNDYKAEFTVEFDINYGGIYYGRIPILDDLSENANISFNGFVIYKDFDNKNEEEFKEFMIDVYKIYVDYYEIYNDDDIFRFKFDDGNPFFEDYYYGYYKDGGYVREDEENIYIYNNASPIIVQRNEID